MLIRNNAKPVATAQLRGQKEDESIRGKVDFYRTREGTLLTAEISGTQQQWNSLGSGLYYPVLSGGDYW